MLSLDYLAGFFDGEGCICIKRANLSPYKTGVKRQRYTLQVTLGNTVPTVVMELKNRFGGSIKLQQAKPQHSVCYVWFVHARLAENFLNIIEPYLVVKKPQAKIALEFQSMVRTNRGGDKLNPVSEQELSQREGCRLRMVKENGIKSLAS